MKTLKYWMLFVGFVFILSNNSSAIFTLNDIDDVFPSPDQDKIEGKIIDGASLFLKSYSDVLLFLNEGEISEKGEYNLNTSLGYIERALTNLQQSKSNYQEVLEIVSNVEYVKNQVYKLNTYNYDILRTENFTSIDIFNSVKFYLMAGDVKGIYRKNIEYIENAVILLKRIREQIKNGYKPIVDDCWELIRVYSQTILFGNYATTLSIKALGDE